MNNLRPLHELPPPSTEKQGWPWATTSYKLPPNMPGGRPWPKVSIVTPSFNQGAFLEETIRSVLLQGYPNLEYIIMDGGSTDGSVEIIKKYEEWIDYWQSKPDNGQAEAIHKGFAKATGEIFAYLNSDDLLAPFAIYLAVLFFDQNKESGMVTGDRIIIDSNSDDIGERKIITFPLWVFRYSCGINQEASFFKKSVYYSCGGINETLHYAIDYDLWLRISKISTIDYWPVKLGIFRKHEDSKTVLVTGKAKGDSYVSRMGTETAMIQCKYFSRETGPFTRNFLRRFHGMLKKWELVFGSYRRKRNLIESLLSKIYPQDMEETHTLKKYIMK